MHVNNSGTVTPTERVKTFPKKVGKQQCQEKCTSGLNITISLKMETSAILETLKYRDSLVSNATRSLQVPQTSERKQKSTRMIDTNDLNRHDQTNIQTFARGN